MLEVDIDDLGERGIVKLLSVSEFVLVKALVIVGLDKLDDIVVGVTGLDDDLTLLVRPAGTSRHLFKHVEGPLVATEVREIDHCVGIEDAHNAHGIKIQPFGHHLGTHQDIGAVLRELVDDAVIAVLAACRVQIHARDFLVRKQGVDIVLDAFSTIADDFKAW